MRAEVVRHKQNGGLRGRLDPESLAMRLLSRVFASPARYQQAQRLARVGQWPLVRGGVIGYMPGPLAGWTVMRDLFPVADQTFREWWQEREVRNQ